nr:hypothetical protein [Tanacetum cinerariifolium]
MEEIEEAWV